MNVLKKQKTNNKILIFINTSTDSARCALMRKYTIMNTTVN